MFRKVMQAMHEQIIQKWGSYEYEINNTVYIYRECFERVSTEKPGLEKHMQKPPGLAPGYIDLYA